MHSSFAEGGEHRFTGCGAQYGAEGPWNAVEASLARSPIVAGWPKNAEGRIRNVLDFYVVSVNPHIVIACARRPGEIDRPRMAYPKHFAEGLVIGSELTCEDPSLWTSPPYASLQDVTRVSEDVRRIEFQRTTVLFKRYGKTWFAVREGR